MKNFIMEGGSLELTAPSGGVVAGKGYQIGKLFVVADSSAAQTEKFIGATCGVFELDKTTGMAFTEGQELYYVLATKLVTNTSNSAANPKIGNAIKAAASGDVLCQVKLFTAVAA